MGHITAKMSPKEKLEFQYSPQTGHSFCVGMGPNSDLEGIMDLAKQILFEGKRTCLALYTEEKSGRPYIDYGVMDGDFFQLNRRTDEHKKLFTKNQLSADKRVKEISKVIARIYNSGTIAEGSFPVRITSMYRINEKLLN
jgi:hypothetical protein